MSKSIFQNPEHVAKIGYNGFPLRNHLKFSSTTGQLLPVFFHYLNPGDKVDCQTIIQSRTQTLETAAWTNIEEHIEWFFVPLRQLFKLFGDKYFNISDINTTLINTNNGKLDNPSKLPVVYFYKSIIAPIIYHHLNFTKDDTWLPYIKGAIRLAELLHYPIQTQYVINYIIDTINELKPDPNFVVDISLEEVRAKMPSKDFTVNLWFLLAYHRIYYSYYRLTDRELNEPSMFNLDTFYDTSVIENTQFLTRPLFKIHYRPLQKDFFRANLISPIFANGDIGSLSNSSEYPNMIRQNWLLSPYSGSQDDVLVSPNSELTLMENVKGTSLSLASPVGSSVSYNVNTAAIRGLFAQEKLLEISRRAAKHYDAQLLAHFGVKINNRYENEAIFLGSHTSQIQIGDVISTSDVPEGSDLGQVGGKGYNSDASDHIKFEAHEHGILMAIYSAVPDMTYYGAGLDRLLTYSGVDDFYIPEYDNLGYQPFYYYQSYADSLLASSVDEEHSSKQILGWTPRFYEQKAKYNLALGALGYYGSLKSWSVTQNPPQGNNLSMFLSNTNMLDNIMLTSFDRDNVSTDNKESFIGSIYDSDPLIHDLYFSVNLASKMSTYGLPSL